MPEPNPFLSFKESLKSELKPCHIIRESGPGFSVFGLNFGYLKSLGNDAIRFSKGGGCVNIAFVDGVLSGHGNNIQLSPERIEAEILAKKLLEAPLADIDLDKTLSSAKNVIKQEVPEKYELARLTAPFAVVNLTPDKLYLLGNGDITVLAFKPRGKDFEIQLLHYDPVIKIPYPQSVSRKSDSIPGTGLVKSNLDFPEGSFFYSVQTED